MDSFVVIEASFAAGPMVGWVAKELSKIQTPNKRRVLRDKIITIFLMCFMVVASIS